MPRQILIVEDNFELRPAVTRALKRRCSDVKIEWATTAEETLAYINDLRGSLQRTYDLIVTDIALQGRLDGLQLWEILQHRIPRAPMMFISGMPMEIFPSCGKRRLSQARFLPKPFALREFIALSLELMNSSEPSSWKHAA